MIKRYLNSGFDFSKDEFDLRLRYHFFNLVLFLNMFAVTLAGFFRFYQNEYTQMLVDFLYVFVSSFLVFLIRLDKKYFDLSVKVAILIAYMTVAVTFYIGASNFTGLGWYFILMLVSFFLTDKKFSLSIFVLSAISILLTIYLKHGHLSLENLPFGLIPFLVFSIFLGLYNKRNEIQKALLKEQNEILEAYSFNLENYDSLTKLPNRLSFKDKLQDKVDEFFILDKQFAVIKLDLDDFKKINDTYGHSFGDDILKIVSIRLKSFLKIKNNLSKVGIDEFIFTSDMINSDRLVSFVKKVQDIVKKEIVYKDKTLFLTSSIGIALYNKDGKDVETLMKHVDLALHQGKKQTRDHIWFYHTNFGELLHDEMSLLSEVKNAIEKEEFEVYYQPQINARTGKVSGMEALVRWNSSVYQKIITPDDFIPFAEEYGLIKDIDLFVLKSSIKEFKSWKEIYPNIGRLAINLSIKVLSNKEYFINLKNVIKELEFNPHWLELEILEGHIMEDKEVCIDALNELDSMGIRLAIDDFGTGYSSLAYIQKLPVHKIKIDKSFVDDIFTSKDGANLVKSIIHMSKNLNLDTLAEGVEEEIQKEFLLDNGCENIQGYFYSKPIPKDEMGLFLEKNQG